MSKPRGPADPISARGLALWILLRVERAGSWASILLDRSAPRLGDARDAALLRELVLGVLRRRSTIDHVIARVASRPLARLDLELLVALRLGAYELLYLERIPEFATVDTIVRLVKATPRRAAASMANAVLRRIARERHGLLPPPPEPGDLDGLALFHSHPRWWVDRIVARRGWRAAAALLELQNRPARAVLRPNLARTSKVELAARLAEEGILVEPCRFVADALRVSSGAVGRSRALAEGLGWVQDEASQLVPTLFGPRVGPRVADLCAAPGAKSFQLTQSLVVGGYVLAADRHLGRLRRLESRARILGLGDLLAVGAELGTGHAPFAGLFDDLLLDAPCSGTGTLRRHPEIRWRLRPEDLERLASRQAALLAAAAPLVAPGGRLVYSVCSLEPEEGERVLHDFLARHPRFRLAEPEPPLADAVRGRGGSLQTGPLTDGLDGFFGALLVRDDSSR